MRWQLLQHEEKLFGGAPFIKLTSEHQYLFSLLSLPSPPLHSQPHPTRSKAHASKIEIILKQISFQPSLFLPEDWKTWPGSCQTNISWLICSGIFPLLFTLDIYFIGLSWILTEFYSHVQIFMLDKAGFFYIIIQQVCKSCKTQGYFLCFSAGCWTWSSVAKKHPRAEQTKTFPVHQTGAPSLIT